MTDNLPKRGDGDKLREMERRRETRRERLFNALYIISGAFLVATIVLAIVGSYLGLFSRIDMSWLIKHKSGLYADCSDPKNQGNTLCQRAKQTASDKQWSHIKNQGGKKHSPFQLYK